MPRPSWWVYILRCRDATFYTGITTDPAARLAAHNAGRGARYTRGRRPVALVHLEAVEDRPAAQRREAAIKRLSRAGKEGLAAAETARLR